MAYENLKTAIKQAIKQNGNQEITGNLLQSTLLNIVNTLGADYKFLGFASPSTVPPTSEEGRLFYFASRAGDYVNFPTTGENTHIITGEGLYMFTKETNSNYWKEEILIDVVQDFGNSMNKVVSQKFITENQEDINSILNKPDFKITKNGYLDKNNILSKDAYSYFTDTYISTKKGMVFYVTAKTQFGHPCIYLMLDANKKVISYLNTDGTDYTNERIEITDPNVKFIRFSSYGKELKVTMTDNFSRIAENEKNIAKNQEAITSGLEKKADLAELEKKFDKSNIAQALGESEDKVISQKVTSDKLKNLTLISNVISCSGLIAIGDAVTDSWEKNKVLDFSGNAVDLQYYETSPYIEHSGVYNRYEFVSFKSSYPTSYNNVCFYKNNTFSFSINVPAKEGVIVSFLLPKGYSCRISTRRGLGDWYIKSINAERFDNYLHRNVNSIITDIYNTLYGKYIDIIKGGWLTKNNGLITESASYYTDYIKVKQGDVFSITAKTLYGNPCVYIILDEDKKALDYLYTAGQYNNYELVISSDKAYWVRFSSYQSPLLVEYKSNIKSASGITLDKGKGTYPFFDEIDAIKGGWLTNEDKVSAQESSYYTDYIKVKKGDTFFVKANTEHGNPCIYIIFDENKKVLSFLNKEGKYAWLKVKITDEKAAYIRFSSFNSILVVDKETTSKYPNALFGKKYAFCGDSFTESILSELTDENGLSGKNSPEYWDKHKNMWKSYAWHICNRNNMLSYADGVSGSRMTIVYNDDGSIKTTNSFSNERYKKIPLDADYCTLMFGLNEINVPLGTKDSTDKSTLWGAWNVVLEYLITNHPYMKIGIIIPDAWETKEQSAELKKIAQWWGIPYLDLKDENISVNIGGRYEGLNSKVATLRNKAFQISDSNAHPNAKAQLYRSYAIEEFIRKL